MTVLADQGQRERALDPHTSFIVQAPAGSGKTELLVQRFLMLLANVQQAPEEIIAITFTRKAAAEMRERILQALRKAADDAPATSAHSAKTQQLAQLVLQRDRLFNWNLLRNPNRLRINTIDALCLNLARQIPLLAKLGTQPKALTDPEKCYRQAVQRFLNHLTGQETYLPSLEILLSHLDNHYGNAEKLLIDMLAHRDQWLPHLLSTSNTKNAAQFRTILQQGLANIVLERVQNCAQLFPEHLKQIFLLLIQFAASQLPEKHTLAACRDLKEFPEPILAEHSLWRVLAQFLLTQKYQLRKQVTKNEGFPAEKTAHYQSMKQAMVDLLAELQQDNYQDFRQALQELCEAPPIAYSDTQWQVVEALIKLLPLLAAQLQLVFQEQNGMDFVGIANAAIQALGELDAPSQLALHLDYHIRHLLVDEFQDTSLTQFRLLELLTAGWQMGDGRTLFLVGDPMQSIYRFRQAEVGLFLRARRQGIGSLQLESLVLSVNFRAAPDLVKWINEIFNAIFPRTENIAQGAIRYTSCVAAKTAEREDGMHFHPFITADAEKEATQIIEIITKRWQVCPQENIGILVRSRSHLQAIVPALQRAGLPFQAIDIEKLSARPIIDDLLALTRALFHLADRTAWLAILRAPWCGLTLLDLHHLANQQPSQPLWQILNCYQELPHLSQDARQRLQRFVPILQAALLERGRKSARQWVEGTWWALGGPACLLDESDLHYAQIYFALLSELAQNSYTVDLPTLSDKLATQYTTPIQTAAARIYVMTIHKAKGLEFDTIILPGLAHCQRQEANRLLMWMERPRQQEDSDLILAPIHPVIKDDLIYDFLRNEQQKKDRYELARLLYVAVTRARRSLHLLGNVQQTSGELKLPPSGSFLELLWPMVQHEFNIRLQTASLTTAEIINLSLISPLYRLKMDWNFPKLQSTPALALIKATISAATINETATVTTRLIGNIVHQMLQKMSQCCLSYWNENKIHAQRKFWQKILLEQGIPAAKLEVALEAIATALTHTLQDKRGRWLLNYRHQDAHSEYPLTVVLSNNIVHLVIDRTFVAEDGARWIVDYKTAIPNDSNIEAFLDAQQQQYQTQLQRYAQAMRARDKERSIRLGLYFPLCGLWREWPAEIGSQNLSTVMKPV